MHHTIILIPLLQHKDKIHYTRTSDHYHKTPPMHYLRLLQTVDVLVNGGMSDILLHHIILMQILFQIKVHKQCKLRRRVG